MENRIIRKLRLNSIVERSLISSLMNTPDTEIKQISEIQKTLDLIRYDSAKIVEELLVALDMNEIVITKGG